jgi:hypothetical protein
VVLPNLIHALSTEPNTDRSIVNEENWQEMFVLFSALLARLQQWMRGSEATKLEHFTYWKHVRKFCKNGFLYYFSLAIISNSMASFRSSFSASKQFSVFKGSRRFAGGINILSQMNPDHTLPPYFVNIHFNISFHVLQGVKIGRPFRSKNRNWIKLLRKWSGRRRRNKAFY